MSTPAVLVPFKGAKFKSRLAPLLSAERRREFAYILLEQVLDTICEAGLRRRTYLVSPDTQAAARSERVGVHSLREPKDSGVNGAVRLGIRTLARSSSFMVVPSDLALLSASDLKYVLHTSQGSSVVIAPSSAFNGTNLLVFPRGFAGSLSYDDNSFWNHLAAAARRSLRTSVLTRRGLVFDVDTPDDARELVDLPINTAAVRFLRKSLGK